MSRFASAKNNNFFQPRLKKSFSVCETKIIIPEEVLEVIPVKIQEVIEIIEYIPEDIKPVEIEEIIVKEEPKQEEITIEFNEVYYETIAENFSETNPNITVKKKTIRPGAKKDLFKLIVEQVILNKKKDNINGWII